MSGVIGGKRYHWVVQVTGVFNGVPNEQIAGQLARQMVSLSLGAIETGIGLNVVVQEETPEFLAEKERLGREQAAQLRDGANGAAAPASPLFGRRRGRQG